eukprot:3759461-Pleurochrysis_carterae.AAC.2
MCRLCRGDIDGMMWTTRGIALQLLHCAVLEPADYEPSPFPLSLCWLCRGCIDEVTGATCGAGRPHLRCAVYGCADFESQLFSLPSVLKSFPFAECIAAASVKLHVGSVLSLRFVLFTLFCRPCGPRLSRALCVLAVLRLPRQRGANKMRALRLLIVLLLHRQTDEDSV